MSSSDLRSAGGQEIAAIYFERSVLILVPGISAEVSGILHPISWTVF